MVFQTNILNFIGGEDVIDAAVNYNTIIFSGSIFIVEMAILSGILRAEGDMNRSLYIMALSSVLNSLLDPVLMFYFNMDIQGAALSTVISSIIPCLLMLYWLVIKEDTYSKLKKEFLKIDFSIMYKLLSVGIPASLETICIAIQLALVNTFLADLISTNAVAAYTSAMRIMLFGTIPSVGLRLTSVSLIGASFGGGKFKRIKDIFHYGTKLSIYIDLVIGIIVFIFAPQIAMIFNYSGDASPLINDIVLVLRLMLLFFLSQPIGSMCSGYFQGIGNGNLSLLTTFIQELVCPLSFMLIFINAFKPSLTLIILSVVLGKITGAIISWSGTNFHANRNIRKYGFENESIVKSNL